MAFVELPSKDPILSVFVEMPPAVKNPKGSTMINYYQGLIKVTNKSSLPINSLDIVLTMDDTIALSDANLLQGRGGREADYLTLSFGYVGPNQTTLVTAFHFCIHRAVDDDVEQDPGRVYELHVMPDYRIEHNPKAKTFVSNREYNIRERQEGGTQVFDRFSEIFSNKDPVITLTHLYYKKESVPLQGSNGTDHSDLYVFVTNKAPAAITELVLRVDPDDDLGEYNAQISVPGGPWTSDLLQSEQLAPVQPGANSRSFHYWESVFLLRGLKPRSQTKSGIMSISPKYRVKYDESNYLEFKGPVLT